MQTGSLPQRLNAQLPVQPANQQFAKRQRCSRPVRSQAAVLDKAATTLNTKESERVSLQILSSPCTSPCTLHVGAACGLPLMHAASSHSKAVAGCRYSRRPCTCCPVA